MVRNALKEIRGQNTRVIRSHTSSMSASKNILEEINKLLNVKGFIDNKGQNCESCGVWKVYCNREEKDKLFLK